MTYRYNSSLGRILFLAVMLVMVMVIISSSPAQPATPAAPADAQPRAQGVFSIILQNIDPVFAIIALLSVAGLTFTIQGFLQNRRSVLMPDATVRQIRELIGQRRYKELIDFTEADGSFISQALNPALRRAPDFEEMKQALETALAEQTADRFRKIEYLNIIGNLGPLLGLLGTVLGMIYAFSEMNAAGGNASPAQLAYGVSKALAHTFLGLALAVPCLAFFGVLRTIIDRLTVQASLLAEELLLMIRPADARQAAGPARPAVVTPPAPAPARKPAPPSAAPADL